MVTMDMARGLLNRDMVDIMARLMSMKTVSMVLMVTMEVMDMVRELLMLSLDIMATHLVMTTGFRDSMVIMAMVVMAMVKDLLNLDMVDIMARLMSMKTVSMVLMVTMEVMVMVRELLMLSLGTMVMHLVMTTGFRDSMVTMAMARGLLNLDMVDTMAKLMSMKTVSMVLMVTMVVMDMVRELLMRMCMTD